MKYINRRSYLRSIHPTQFVVQPDFVPLYTIQPVFLKVFLAEEYWSTKCGSISSWSSFKTMLIILPWVLFILQDTKGQLPEAGRSAACRSKLYRLCQAVLELDANVSKLTCTQWQEVHFSKGNIYHVYRHNSVCYSVLACLHMLISTRTENIENSMVIRDTWSRKRWSNSIHLKNVDVSTTMLMQPFFQSVSPWKGPGVSPLFVFPLPVKWFTAKQLAALTWHFNVFHGD